MPRIEFKGKSFVQNHHLAVPFHQLVPDKAKSLTDKVSLQDNLIIHGDNLLALKALLPTYAGKVKCIYIDPPYNTGNESWVYSDRVNSPMMKEWLGKVVGREGEDLTRHDKWLCMMMPRLKLLRELLTEDGLIFISIDDNEHHNLRVLVDEVLGETNFIADIIWQKVYSGKADATHIGNFHEYILCYAKNVATADVNLLPRSDVMNARYTNPDNDPRGNWLSNDLTAAEERTHGHYNVISPTGIKYNSPEGKHWSYSESKMQELLADNRVWFGSNGTAFPRLKRFLSEVQQGRKANTLWLHDEVGHSDEATKELQSIFPEKDAKFPTPKPSRLIKQILKISTNEDSIVLDSFSGSGTTGQAVLELNKEDGGNRKFILVEMEDYADKITAERMRRIIKGIPNAKNELIKNSLNGTFSYFTLGDAIETQSLLSGKHMPSYKELARYVFYTATGEDFDEPKVNEAQHFIGKSSFYDIYMYYKPDIEYLKTSALTLDEARKLRKEAGDRHLLVFAPTKYVEQTELDNLRISFCQLPFEIYKLKV